MIIRFLGTGNAFHSSGRGAQAFWFELEGNPPFLVDAGPTALLALKQNGLSTDALETLVVTHLHGDHIAGWPFLVLDLLFVGRRTRPFRVIGPTGTRARLETLLDACYPRIFAEHAAFPLAFEELDVAPRSGVETTGVPPLDVVPLEHTDSSIGYRFHARGQRIAVSGDTAWCEGLESLARDTSVLILECTSLEPGAGKHVSLAELRARRDRLAAERIVLVHLDDDIAAALARDPLPGVSAAEDGLVLEL